MYDDYGNPIVMPAEIQRKQNVYNLARNLRGYSAESVEVDEVLADAKKIEFFIYGEVA